MPCVEDQEAHDRRFGLNSRSLFLQERRESDLQTHRPLWSLLSKEATERRGCVEGCLHACLARRCSWSMAFQRMRGVWVREREDEARGVGGEGHREWEVRVRSSFLSLHRKTSCEERESVSEGHRLYPGSGVASLSFPLALFHSRSSQLLLLLFAH